MKNKTTYTCARINQNLSTELPYKNAAWVGWIAAVKREQQIQGWEAEDLHMGAAARASAGDNICNAIAVAIVYANANAACKVFCVGIKLRK